jgi:mRNA interferase RelE/StbE
MILWKIRLTPEAAKILSRLHPENKKLIKAALKQISESPYSGTDLQEELSGFKSFKPKRYRILYKANEDEQTVEIYHIGHRKDVYEQFKRLLTRFNTKPT